MADLLLGVSQLIDQTTQPGWQPGPDLANLVSPSVKQTPAIDTASPAVDEPESLRGTPQFVATSVPSAQPQEKLRRLLETATLPDGVSLEQLLASAPSLEAERETRLATLQSSASAPGAFRVTEITPQASSAPSLNDLIQGISAAPSSLEIQVGEATNRREFNVPQPTAGAATSAPKPAFTPPQPTTTLSFVSTPQALAMARQQVVMPQGPRPASGSQLYGLRQAALQAGKLYTRVSPDSFYDQWVNTAMQPTYEQWKALLAHEASAIANGQGQNKLTVVVGDSLSLWLPPDMLPQDRFWLNQGISGDTTQGILNRLSAFANTRPDTIHVMAGVNDLKNGASNAEVLVNLQRIMEQLRQQHPQARIIVHSILPTRLTSIPSDRIRALNQDIAKVAERQRVVYLDLGPSFTDEIGNLRYELTTDGIHLSRLGYQVWQIAMLAI